MARTTAADAARQEPKKEPSSRAELEVFGVTAEIVAEIRQRYEVDPSSVHESWATLFDAHAVTPPASPATTRSAEEPPRRTGVRKGRGEIRKQIADQHARVLRLIHS
jgi:2-oxoglutarate dehydrogenase complex dehydrogenase (E1) component-like enzyme